MCIPVVKIQDSELEIMHVLWSSEQPVALARLRKELAEKRGWEDSTIKTLLRRLCDKGAAQQAGRGMYSAVVTEDEYGRWAAKHFIGKVFNNSAKKLVAALLSDGQLSGEDIAELSALINRETADE